MDIMVESKIRQEEMFKDVEFENRGKVTKP